MLAPRPARPDFLTRRATLGTLGALAMSSGLPFGLAGGSGSRLNAAEDAAAPAHKHFFKLSLAAYSFRDALAGKSPTMTLDDFIRLCAEYQLDGCELTSYYFPKSFDAAYLSHLKQLTHRLGLDVSGTAIAQDFCQADGDKRTADIAHTKAWIDHAAAFGAPCIRIFAGSVPKGMTEEAAIQNCVRGIEECLPHAAEKGVILALENHGGITDTPEQMLKIVTGVKPNPYFGVNFDGGNFRTADPYADLAKIAPYAVNAQLKVDLYPEGKKQPADFAKTLGLLKAAGYRGYIVLEYEGEDEAKTAVPKVLSELRALIASV
jgi:sugar phosphate isomerase/epimerase